MDYRDRIAHHIKSCINNGMTQKEIAQKLDLPKANYISMLIGKDRKAISPFPLKRLPALVDLCDLDAVEALCLFRLRAKEPNGSSCELDLDLVNHFIRWTVEAIEIVKARRLKHVTL